MIRVCCVVVLAAVIASAVWSLIPAEPTEPLAYVSPVVAQQPESKASVSDPASLQVPAAERPVAQIEPEPSGDPGVPRDAKGAVQARVSTDHTVKVQKGPSGLSVTYQRGVNAAVNTPKGVRMDTKVDPTTAKSVDRADFASGILGE